MNKELNNMLLCLRSDAREAEKLAKAITKIPGVETRTVQVYHAPENESTGEYASIRFTAIHAEFEWHGHSISIVENHNGQLIVKYDGTEIGQIFWSALWGKLESSHTEKLTKAQEYILDCLWKVVHKISAKGRPYEKVALPKPVQYGDCHIWADGATVFAERNGKRLRVMGNTWRGLNWTACDPTISEIQKVLKKAFIVY